MTLDLRSAFTNPTPAAPTAAPTAVLPPSVVARASAGPLPLGTVMRYTPEEEANFARLGFDPASVPVVSLDEFVRTIPTVELGPGLVNPPPSVDISELPPQRQQEIRDGITRAIAAAAHDAQVSAAMPAKPSSPDVARTIAAAMAPTPPMSPKQDSGTSPAPAPAAAPAPAPAPTMETAAPPTICPHCSGDVTADPTPVTDDMKRDFLTMLAGGRLVHTFTLMGGSVSLTFRSLTRLEDDLVLMQTAYDEQAGRIASPGEYLRHAENYRAILSLAGISIRGGAAPQLQEVLPELSTVQFDAVDAHGRRQTAVRPFADYVNEKILTTLTLRRLVAEYALRFGDILNACTRQAANPDFWQGIATLP